MRRHEPDMLPVLNQGPAQAACAAIQKSSPVWRRPEPILELAMPEARARYRGRTGAPGYPIFETCQHRAERLLPSLIAKRMNEDLFVDDETVGSGRESKA